MYGLAMMFVVAALVSSMLTQAQFNGRLSGIVSDGPTGRPLEGATVAVLSQATGIFIKHAVSGKKGDFQVSGLPTQEKLEVVVSYAGYRDTAATYTFGVNNRVVVTGNWPMRPAHDDLDSVAVTFRRPPFVIRKDTLEFDARGFKSLPAEMLQDLLRKIPGMVVDAGGNVTVHGKKVSKIQVDGREFFTGSLKTVLANVPGNIIDKIQVTDTRERGTEHNSIIYPIAESVTLNLTLRQENKKGFFGHGNAGAGTLDRYTAGGFLDVLHGAHRAAVVVNTGNALGGGEAGILHNATSAGINANTPLGRRGTIDFSYMTDNTRQTTHTLTDQTNILPDSSFQYHSDAHANAYIRNHALRADYVYSIDSLQQLTIAPEVTYSDNTSSAAANGQSITTSGALINSQDNRSESGDKTWVLQNRLTYGLASQNRKNSLQVNWIMGVQNQAASRGNLSDNQYYHTTVLPVQRLDQQTTTLTRGISNNLSVNLVRVLSKQFTAIASYSVSQSLTTNHKDTYTVDSLTGRHDIPDSIYSVHTRNTGGTHLPAASLGFHTGKLSIEAGVGVRLIQQQNHIDWRDSSIQIHQRNVIPTLTTAYQFARQIRWITHYSVDATAPTPDQLSPAPDNTNPLYIQLGNPGLLSAITHQLHSQLQFFSRDYTWHSSAGFSANISDNAIVEDTYYDSLARQINTFTNANGIHQMNAQFSGGRRFGLKGLTINTEAGLSLIDAKSRMLLNHGNAATTTTWSPSVDIGLQYEQYLSVQLHASLDFNKTTYSLPAIPAITYRTSTIQLFWRAMPVKRIVFSGNGWYTYNSQLPESFERSRTIINAAVTYQLLKGEKLSVGLSVNDLLNNNTTVTRTVMPTGIQNTQVDAVRRYVLININYRFNHFNL